MARIKETAEEEHDIALEFVVRSVGGRAQETIVNGGDSNVVVTCEPKRGELGRLRT